MRIFKKVSHAEKFAKYEALKQTGDKYISNKKVQTDIKVTDCPTCDDKMEVITIILNGIYSHTAGVCENCGEKKPQGYFFSEVSKKGN